MFDTLYAITLTTRTHDTTEYDKNFETTLAYLET